MKILLSPKTRNPIQVELSPKEVDVIVFALRRVGGDTDGPRGTVSQLLEDFHEAEPFSLWSDYRSSNHLPDTWKLAYGE